MHRACKQITGTGASYEVPGAIHQQLSHLTCSPTCRTLSNNWLNGTLPESWGALGAYPKLTTLTISDQGSEFTGESPPRATSSACCCSVHQLQMHTGSAAPACRHAACKLGRARRVPKSHFARPVGIIHQRHASGFVDQRGRRLFAAVESVSGRHTSAACQGAQVAGS